jgi:transposase-like protein
VAVPVDAEEKVPVVPSEPIPPPRPSADAEAGVPIEDCRYCGSSLSVPVARLGEKVRCPRCGETVRAETALKRPPRRRGSRRWSERYECPECGCDEYPYRTTAISETGWILFAVLLVTFFPLFWIGLLMTEPRWVCPDCLHRFPYKPHAGYDD